MTEFAAIVLVLIFLYVLADAIPEKKNTDPFADLSLDPETPSEYELRDEAERLFKAALAEYPLPPRLAEHIVELHRMHVRWRAFELLGIKDQSSHAITVLSDEAQVHARQVTNQIGTFLPPLPMIEKGNGLSVRKYKEIWLRDYTLPSGWERSEIDEGSPSFNEEFGYWPSFQDNLFKTKITLRLPDHLRPQAHMIMAPPGQGKTNTLLNMILDDVETGASLIVMDSQDEMIEKLLRVLPEERLAYLDAGALDRPLAMSPFAIGSTDGAAGETNASFAVELLENMIASDDFELTARQRPMFRHLCRLLSVIPGSGFDTALEILEQGYEPYDKYLSQLPNRSMDFVRKHLATEQGRSKSEYADARGQIGTRFETLSDNPALERMFNSPDRKVDFGQLIKDRKITLINTDQGRITPSGASVVGRYCLMQIALEVLRRPATKDPKKRIYVYIDEAHGYFGNDAILRLLLAEGRKRGLCMVFAFQEFGQITEKSAALGKAFRSMTAIKFVKAGDASDANMLSKDMKTTPESLMNIPRYTFGVHCRDVGFGIFGMPDAESRLKPVRSGQELIDLKDRMYERYCYDPSEADWVPEAEDIVWEDYIPPEEPEQFADEGPAYYENQPEPPRKKTKRGRRKKKPLTKNAPTVYQEKPLVRRDDEEK